MPRSVRIVIPELAHHVIQRGNRRQPIFFSDLDRQAYLDLLAIYCKKSGTRCLAWCLMDNHVHLVLVPSTADGLRAALAPIHTAYSQRINAAQSSSGHLFQGRFLSYPMDDAHLMVAVRYVENNPVAAGLAERAEDWRWSSARAHISELPDGITDISALGQQVVNWRAMLTSGLEASDQVEAALRTGLPLGADDWRAGIANLFARTLAPQKRGPKPRPVTC